MRKQSIERNTNETKISLSINLEGTGKSEVESGCGLMDHMLTLFSKHARFDLNLKCLGDTQVDYHHTVEDIGIVLGTAFLSALSDLRGIKRYANIILPMDEALILAAVDISGRGHLEYDLSIPTQKVGDFDTELTREFFEAFIRTSKITLHLKQISGLNSHHIIEGAFKAFARVLKEASSIDEKYSNEIPSTKGTLL